MEKRKEPGKRNLQALNKGMESQKGTWQPCDWGVLPRPLSLALGDPHIRTYPICSWKRRVIGLRELSSNDGKG